MIPVKQVSQVFQFDKIGVSSALMSRFEIKFQRGRGV